MPCCFPQRAGAKRRVCNDRRVADVCITEYTDPGCPWAYSAEPFRRRLSWLYGDALEWQVALVGLAASPDEYLDKGFGPEQQSKAFKKISRDHRMPMNTGVRPRMAATIPACRAVVAARLHAPEAMRPLLRRLRVRHFSGELLDAPQTLDRAATDAGLDPAQLRAWAAGDDVSAALEQDMARAREPLPAARVLDDKLANWSGGRRYTCPSYEIVRRSDGVRIAVPGFQPFAVYDVVLANLVPGLGRREPAARAEQVLAWTGTPLATQEVAVVRDIAFEEAHEELSRVAVHHPLGYDGFWTQAEA
jgi:predicted DsbA family dithiol-disulfide isomerase